MRRERRGCDRTAVREPGLGEGSGEKVGLEVLFVICALDFGRAVVMRLLVDVLYEWCPHRWPGVGKLKKSRDGQPQVLVQRIGIGIGRKLKPRQAES